MTMTASDPAEPSSPWHLPHISGSWKTAVFFGFLGGIIPTCLKIASAFAAQQQDMDMPRLTFWLAVAFYGIVGTTVALAFRQYSSREAFIAGIIAPSLVANLVSGYGEGALRKPIKTTESSILEYISPISRAHADEEKAAIESSTISIGKTEGKITRKIDFEWDVPKDVMFSKVKLSLISTLGQPADKTVFVSPSFDGAVQVPVDYKYISVDNGKPIELSDGTTQLLIHGEARTSKTNDFLWGLGAPRLYKMLNTKVEAVHLSQNGQR